MKYLLIILLAINATFALSQDRVEVLVTTDSCYAAPVDGVFLDLDTYIEISYELEKIDSLKTAIPEFKKELNKIKIATDSMVVADSLKTHNLTTALNLETQSKNQLKKRVFNLQHNYNVMENRHKGMRRQRNILGGILALLGTALVIF